MRYCTVKEKYKSPYQDLFSIHNDTNYFIVKSEYNFNNINTEKRNNTELGLYEINDGKIIYRKIYDSPYDDYPRGIIGQNNQTYIILSLTVNFNVTDSSHASFCLIKIDSQGNSIMKSQMYNAHAIGITNASNDCFVVTCSKNFSHPQNRILSTYLQIYTFNKNFDLISTVDLNPGYGEGAALGTAYSFNPSETVDHGYIYAYQKYYFNNHKELYDSVDVIGTKIHQKKSLSWSISLNKFRPVFNTTSISNDTLICFSEKKTDSIQAGFRYQYKKRPLIISLNKFGKINWELELKEANYSKKSNSYEIYKRNDKNIIIQVMEDTGDISLYCVDGIHGNINWWKRIPVNNGWVNFASISSSDKEYILVLDTFIKGAGNSLILYRFDFDGNFVDAKFR
jgi:hypothetical protein